MTSWKDVDFTDPLSGNWPVEHKRVDSWMTHRHGDKKPYAPWTDPDAPAPCSECGTDTSECDHSARFKWGWEGNRRPFKDAMMSLADRSIEGLVFIQTEDDPFVFVDGDDVRCPESGVVHPAFEAIISHLGLSYADISTSGAGVHVYYRGTLPGNETVATWELDTEPWGENNDRPAIEIYSGKHVCLATGDQPAATPDEVRPWNGEIVRAMLEANGEIDETPTESLIGAVSEDEPSQSTSENVADDVEQCFRALRRLDAEKVADKTIVAEWTDPGGAGKGFLPVWGSSDDGGTANFVDSVCWVDTGHNGGRGGPVEMALIDLGELRNTESEMGAATGSDFWTGYEHLRDLGFHLPKPPYEDGNETVNDYYDVDLDSYVDGDPWSDPEMMLDACLRAREEGAVTPEVEPPTLALIGVAKQFLDIDNPSEETKEMALSVYREDLTA